MPNQSIADIFILALTEWRDAVRAERKARLHAMLRGGAIGQFQDLRTEFTDSHDTADLQPTGGEPWLEPLRMHGRD